MLTRRKFGQLSGLTLGSLLVGSWMSCNKAADLIGSLRGILDAVEKALSLLAALSGLLPDAVNTAAAWLIKVCEFVANVDNLLQDTMTSAADKMVQILNWAGDLILPTIPPPIGPILVAVLGAVNHFLSIFNTDVDHAKTAARTRSGEVPKMDFNDQQRAQLKAMSADALKDKQAVMDWQKKAMATPAK